MSYILSAELAATCNALGSFDPKTNTYFSDENTLETVKDLIRYLRRDNESYDTRRQLGDTKVLQTDLIPLMKLHWKETELFDVLIRLLGNLTSPVLLLYNEEIPTDKTVRNQFLQILGHLQSYKESFTDDDVWAVICTRLSQLLNMEWEERGEENSLIIERILILVRNVLNVPADPDAERRTDNDVSTHDKVIWALQRSGTLDIFLYMFSSENEETYYMYLLEILTLILREQLPADVATAAIARSDAEKGKDEAELLAIRQREINRKQDKMKKFNGARHSRFGGTYTVKNVMSITDNNPLIYHKSIGKLSDIDLDTNKSKVKTPKNRLPVHSTTTTRKSTFSIRLFLKDFCVEFLNGAYNRIMQNVRGRLVRAKPMVYDETYYLWAMKFFMEFNRYYKFDIKLVSETMHIQIFHYVQLQMENHFEMIQSDKKKWKLWSKRLHNALMAYRELFFTLNSMEKSPDSSVCESASVIKSNVFYVVEYREFILTLLLTYNPLRMTREYLVDLLETQHVFLKMFEVYCGKGSSVVVQQKRRARGKKKKKKSAPVQPELGLDSKWDEVGPQIVVVLEGGKNIPDDVVPFDATSDVPIDEQKAETMRKIQRHLWDGEFETSIGLLRAAREVWPENDDFGNSTMAVEEEYTAIHEIFFAQLQNQRADPTPAEEPDEDEENEEEVVVAQHMETDFDFSEFIKRFAHPKIVQACGLVLEDFMKNKPTTNHYVLKLLHRISWDCRMHAIIFQASVFRTFQKIFEEKNDPAFKELVKFAIYIIRKFIAVSKKNPMAFMELLFWKNSREAFEMEEGYGTYQEKSKAAKALWSEYEEDELRTLFMEHKNSEVTTDVVDWILNNLVNNTRTRRSVIKKLKELMLLDYKGAAKSSSRAPKEWAQDEVEQLTELFHSYKEATDPLGCIADRLTVRRPRNRVADKIVELGLVQDKKELRKKRTKKSSMLKSATRAEDFNSDLNTTDSSDGSGDETGTRNPANRTKRSKSASVKIHRASPSEIAKLLIETVQKGFSESLKWIQENVTEAADDLEQEIDLDSNEGVPLVAISDCDVQAMEDPLFTKMLLSLGIKMPSDEQEMYWRIPGHLTVQQLRNIADLIVQAVEGQLSVPEPVQSTSGILQKATQVESSDDDDIFDRLRTYGTKPNDERPSPMVLNSSPKSKTINQQSSEDENFENLKNNKKIHNDNSEVGQVMNKKQSEFAEEHEQESDTSDDDFFNISTKSNLMNSSDVFDQLKNSKETENNSKNVVETSLDNNLFDRLNDENLGNVNKKQLNEQIQKNTIEGDSDDSMSSSSTGNKNIFSKIKQNIKRDYTRRNKARIISSSDSEDETPAQLNMSSNVPLNTEISALNTREITSRILLASDSDEITHIENVENSSTHLENGKRRHSHLNSDSIDPSLKRRRIILSDNDN